MASLVYLGSKFKEPCAQRWPEADNNFDHHKLLKKLMIKSAGMLQFNIKTS